MKKTITLTLAIFSIILFLFSCDDNKDGISGNDKALVGKWQLEKTLKNGNYQALDQAQKKQTIDFKGNGTYSSVSYKYVMKKFEPTTLEGKWQTKAGNILMTNSKNKETNQASYSIVSGRFRKVSKEKNGDEIKDIYKKYNPKQQSTSTSSVLVQVIPPPNLKSYYANVNFSLTGTDLYNDLSRETITKHTNILSYGERHKYLYKADQDPKKPGNVILMYSSQSRDKREYISSANNHHPQSFNTEHVYPQSLIVNNARGDLHHLRVCDVSINSQRANKPFANGSGTYKNLGNKWYPGDRWKGDVARMIFYLNLRYNEPFNKVGSLELFLKWNAEDPVSAFEIQRNESISLVQGDRNPFIDNPYLATLIWGGPKAENKWSTSKK